MQAKESNNGDDEDLKVRDLYSFIDATSRVDKVQDLPRKYNAQDWANRRKILKITN